MKKAKAIELVRTHDAPPPARVVERDLAEAEAKLNRLLDSSESLISEICHYLVDGGGKRLRPTFVLLVYRACGGTDEKVIDAIDAGIALELIHSATLLHDDIIDGGKLRRGKPSAFARYGFAPTLIAGDFLFCRAFELCGRFEEHLVRTAAQACIELTEGEVMEGRLRHSAAASLRDYRAVITRKTASLFHAGGKVAADLAGASRYTIDAMAKLGMAIGLAFQMVDDVLDIVGPEEKIGKPVGSDLREGIPSLPVVLASQRNPELKGMFQNGGLSGDAFDRALEILRDPELIAEARSLAAAEVRIAREMLGELRASPYRDSLALLIDEQIDREV
ncbi:MAG TPA: polyprenyl synthetase family protein, partial [Candidatus Binataceae bacterium]|nr:polyprenyl synthetase family protein [Candidatus Binataceae bacterium]